MHELFLNKIALFIIVFGVLLSTKIIQNMSVSNTKSSLASQEKADGNHYDSHDHIHVKKLKCKKGVCEYV